MPLSKFISLCYSLMLRSWGVGILSGLLIFSYSLHAQNIRQTMGNLTSRWQNDPFTIAGSLRADAQFNAINGVLRRRDPLNLNLFGQLNLNLLGINAPLSIAVADGNTTYNLPSYSLVGISPSYKWVRLHLFKRSMQFSDYTLSGHGFNGVGVELSPGKFKMMGMIGTLRKARLEDYGFRQELDQHYLRKGYAIKMGYENQKDRIFATIFKASDDGSSLVVPDSLGIDPQENVVFSAEGKKQMSSFLLFEAEYAFSILSINKGYPDRRAYGLENMLSPFLHLNVTSKSSSAYNFNIDFRPVSNWAVSLKYERVNPNFTSLGTLQFRNDFENMSIGYRGKLSKRIAMTGRLGMERNNLDDQEIENRNRFIGALQLNIPIRDRWQNTLSYSNFRQTTRLIDNSNAFEPVDSIFLGSVNNQFGISTVYQLNTANRFMMNLSHQRANSIVNDQITHATSNVSNMSVNYQYAPYDSKLYGGVTLFWNGLKQASMKTSALSPSVHLNYRTSTQINMSFTATNNFTVINNANNGGILRLALGTQYSIAKKQRLDMRIQYMNRSGAVANNFREFNAQVGYSVRF